MITVLIIADTVTVIVKTHCFMQLLQYLLYQKFTVKVTYISHDFN